MITRQYINKLIIINIIEIMCVLSFVIITIPVLLKKSKSYELSLLSDSDNFSYINLEIENFMDYVMFPMSDEIAINKLYPTKLIVENISLTNEEYILTLKIYKNSTMNFEYLKLSVNDEIKNLKELLIKETFDCYFFKIANDSLLGETKEYLVKLWLTENSPLEEHLKELNLTFDLAKSVSRL